MASAAGEYGSPSSLHGTLWRLWCWITIKTILHQARFRIEDQVPCCTASQRSKKKMTSFNVCHFWVKLLLVVFFVRHQLGGMPCAAATVTTPEDNSGKMQRLRVPPRFGKRNGNELEQGKLPLLLFITWKEFQKTYLICHFHSASNMNIIIIIINTSIIFNSAIWKF